MGFYKKKKPPRGFKKKKLQPKSKLKVVVPPTTPQASIPPALHQCEANDSLTFYLIEVKAAADKSPSFSFEFWSAPRSITSSKKTQLNEPKIQGAIQQPLGFQFQENLRYTLTDIVFDGKNRGATLANIQTGLQYLGAPGNRSSLRVFELIVRNSAGITRSYGRFIVLVGNIKELLREPSSGQSLRLSVDMELIEVASYQLDFGADVSIPRTLIPTLPPELTAAASAGEGSSDTAIPTDGRAFPAGTKIAVSGNTGVGTGPHLHLIYWPNDNSRVPFNRSAAESYIRNNGYGGTRGNKKPYPPVITDGFSILKAGKKVPLSKTGLISSPPGPRVPPTAGASSFHVGQDFGLALGTDIFLEYPMSFVASQPEKGPTGSGGYGRTLTMRCSEPGREGTWMLCHLNSVSADLQVSAARATEPNRTSSNKPAVPATPAKPAVKAALEVKPSTAPVFGAQFIQIVTGPPLSVAFKIKGQTKTYKSGDQIGTSGWFVTNVINTVDNEVVIRRNGESRNLSLNNVL